MRAVVYLNLEMNQRKFRVLIFQVHVQDVRFGFRDGHRDAPENSTLVQRADVNAYGEVAGGIFRPLKFDPAIGVGAACALRMLTLGLVHR